jgi:predicted protein tyrosine phosphatase
MTRGAAWNLDEFPLRGGNGRVGSIVTCGLAQVREVIQSFEPQAVVSALSPRRRVGLLPTVPHLLLGFSDVLQATPRRVLMSAGQMATFFSFLDRVGPCRLLIHCSLGVSRSPALALIAADHWGIEYQLPEQALPNPWVLALGRRATAASEAA